ncbi:MULTISPECIES: LysE family translocator [Acinetobacter calcoaceticus/baumannii complex]|uniref:Threonine transporter RhtB n=1 Tax=Acinetobacter nosocomialis TaxID=106654 RepID=A0AB37CQR8_ACINO|nr:MULTISPECIES: LysE family transporter [Acinetobacter calcoaceticus/baumannii complex]AJB49791.1 threonine transporter RhtB [Acinetobacter nosocomialis]ELW77077.1 translocator protein, LysE family [Acinetobacter sp. OIFC021]EXE47917.1 lysE type translocator family protein [Acinetobacter sp. 766875]MBO8210325.1 LysE family transporter [Acinetobacter nosocomialis]MBO8215982.1 LysE family transporter [Acinetobacter nosocomialis]
MIESWFFVLAMLAVLLIPGPTNALLATAAHSQGLSKTFWLIPMQWLGYAYGISFWAVFIHLAAPVWPALLLILHITSVLYVFWMAFRLWKTTHLQQFSQNHRNIRPRQLFFSTLKNPKSLLFAAGIFPAEAWNSPENFLMVFAAFTLTLIPAASFWMIFGRALLTGSMQKIKADHLYKGSAMLLILCMLPVVFRFF